MHLRDIEYKGIVFSSERVYYYRKAREKDVKEIADLYRGCAICRRNCREKLDKESQNSFEKTGGMYLIFGEEEIRRELHNPGSLWAVFLEKGKVAGSFWIAEENPMLEDGRIREYIGEEEPLIYPREIIVSPEYSGEMLGQLLFATAFQALEENGFRYSLCDVYRTAAYTLDGIWKRVDLLNKPSYLNMLSLGGRYQGTGDVREISLECLKVKIEPQIFLFSHKETLKLTKQLFTQKGIQIYAEN
nr:GNAT family N-acetyltransferase [Mediterraneibacter agrestimuris]